MVIWSVPYPPQICNGGGSASSEASKLLTSSVRSAEFAGAYIMKVVDIGLSEIDAFSIQYARAFKPRGFFRAQLVKLK